MKSTIITIAWLVAVGALRAAAAESSPSTAVLISSGSTGVVGKLARDTDVQWYRFLAAPTLVYTVRVDNVSLWDNDLSLRIFADGDAAASTNSAFKALKSSTLVWTNTGGVRYYYVAVSALLQFTTGTYTVAVSANDRDSDGDGLADAWESLYFGGPTNAVATRWNASGTTNGASYATGADPNDPVSALRVTRILARPAGIEVDWPTVPYSAYRVDASTNLLHGVGWSQRAHIETGPTPAPTPYIDATNAPVARYYRVVYEVD